MLVFNEKRKKGSEKATFAFLEYFQVHSSNDSSLWKSPLKANNFGLILEKLGRPCESSIGTCKTTARLSANFCMCKNGFCCGFASDFWPFILAEIIHFLRAFLKGKSDVRNESTFSSFSLFLVCAARTLYFFKIISSPSFQKNQGNIFSWRKKRRTWLEKGVFNCVHF